ncbi:MAG: DNA-3-methyladenine glycosylase [Patescibacteria group bacterium]
MKNVLTQKFFNRPTVEVARDLIGCYLVREQKGKITRYLITETEAYDGPEDLACHASKGRTKRTETMFGQAGHWYVYFVYGIHWMLNIVTGPKNFPAAVLIRGIEGAQGPARLTKKLGISGFLNAKTADEESGLWIEKRGHEINPKDIVASPRIGIDYAGPIWSKKEWRFTLKPTNNNRQSNIGAQERTRTSKP